MAREHIPKLTGPRMMIEHEWRHREWRISATNAEILGRIAGSAIVISSHENQIDAGVASPPFAKRLKHPSRPAGLRMKKVAEEDYLPS
jgi:hypothetical protein